MAKSDKNKAKKLSHYDDAGRASMVDVSAKAADRARSRGVGVCRDEPRGHSQPCRGNPKGDPLEVARVAGILAAKRTSELIPMCHPIPLSKVEVEVEVRRERCGHSHARAHHRRNRSGDGGAGGGVGGSSDGV